ncbi:MAG TPA: choice-of-anchor tandem repeat GloVer-containing protein [Verrucomicrobiae bacterium]|nr:choice-of-anchor tandem repeat GloVer-containing protein [Verrucomicrobiae bacterium]
MTSFARFTGAFLLAFLMTFSGAQGLAQPAQPWQLSILHSFGFPEESSKYPVSGVICGSDGKLYGTASAGGPEYGGTIFRINRSGNHFEILHSFASIWGSNILGSSVQGGVVEASDGRLYGTTVAGGIHARGAVYRINRDGSGFEVLHSFNPDEQDSWAPAGELIEANDGMLYGTAQFGGAFNGGTVFRLNKDGSDYAVIHEFNSADGQGSHPECPLLQASDGLLYGTLTDDYDSGEAENPGKGKIFKLNPDGTGFEVIHDFGARKHDGVGPRWGLVEGRDGYLYSTCQKGGPKEGGIIFKVRKNGADYRILRSFGKNITDSREPIGPLLKGRYGLFYGITRYAGSGAFGGIYCIGENGFFFRVVKQFKDRSGRIEFPLGALAQDSAGNLYGASGVGAFVDGTLFKCTLNGAFRKLHTFDRFDGDGAFPNTQLSSTPNGTLYGTTYAGGKFGRGTIFQLNADGSGYQLLHDLKLEPIGTGTDPTGSTVYFTTITTAGTYSKWISATLFHHLANGKTKVLRRSFRGFNPLVGNDGKIYGVTGNGSIFSINSNGRGFRVLRRFGKHENISSELVQGSDGTLFGTTIFTDENTLSSEGRIFKMKSDGTGFTNLFTLAGNAARHIQLTGPLWVSRDGNLYGTANDYPYSIAYRIGQDGNGFEILHTFNETLTPLVEGADGALYGSTRGLSGAIFRLEKDGSGFNIIQNIENIGSFRFTPLADGSLCGVADYGGKMDLGFVFKLTPPSSRPSSNERRRNFFSVNSLSLKLRVGFGIPC